MNRRIALRTLLSITGVAALSACQGIVPPRPFGKVNGDGKPLSLAVLQALRNSPETNTLILQVYATDDDVIILKGPVPNDEKFYSAERVAGRVAGVARVDNATYVQ